MEAILIIQTSFFRGQAILFDCAALFFLYNPCTQLEYLFFKFLHFKEAIS